MSYSSIKNKEIQNLECCLEIQCSSNEILAPSHDVSMLTTNGCLTCKCEFLEREDQVAHYRSDWHRYNIKLRLLGQANVSEEAFEEIAGKVKLF